MLIKALTYYDKFVIIYKEVSFFEKRQFKYKNIVFDLS